MNIFSNLGFQQASSSTSSGVAEKDREGKEKSRIVENHAVEIREKKRLDTLKKNRRTDANSQQSQSLVMNPLDAASQAASFASLAINSLDAATRQVIDEIYKETFRFD